VNCDELLRLLTEYEEGNLGARLCEEVERHLQGCAPCDKLRAELQELSRLCHDSGPPRLPPELRQRIEKLLRGE
jgi:RNA polymerase sigma-70 factor (ECF subfamily)